MMKQTVAIQCTKRSNAPKRTHDASRPAMLDPHRPANEIEPDHDGDHAQNSQAANQSQRHLIPRAPVATAGLFERAGLLIRKGALAGNALGLT